MKAHLSVFALSAILIASIGMAPAFGQIQSSIVVTTEKSSYSEGDTIIVTGEVRDLYSGTPVSVIVKAPNGNLVSIAQVSVGADKKFSTEITAGGALMKAEGATQSQYNMEQKIDQLKHHLTLVEAQLFQQTMSKMQQLLTLQFQFQVLVIW